jgi:hypothetical protein
MQMLTHFAMRIENWFKKSKHCGLVLPSGWFGRPYDNQHSLSSIEQPADRVTLILDQKLKLQFEGLKSITDEGKDLVLGPFDRLSFEWKPYGNDTRSHHEEFRGGAVRIVSFPE